MSANGLEVYWGIGVSIIAFLVSVISFVVMIINDSRHHKQDTYRFDSLDKGNDRLNGEHDRLSGEHGRLSGEHDRLSGEHNKLSREHDKLSAEHDRLQEKLNEIYINQETDKAAREAAGKSMPEESKLLQLITKIYENHNQLLKRNTELEIEVNQLKLQIIQLTQMEEYTDGLDNDFEDEIE